MLHSRAYYITSTRPGARQSDKELRLLTKTGRPLILPELCIQTRIWRGDWIRETRILSMEFWLNEDQTWRDESVLVDKATVGWCRSTVDGRQRVACECRYVVWRRPSALQSLAEHRRLMRPLAVTCGDCPSRVRARQDAKDRQTGGQQLTGFQGRVCPHARGASPENPRPGKLPLRIYEVITVSTALLLHR